MRPASWVRPASWLSPAARAESGRHREEASPLTGKDAAEAEAGEVRRGDGDL